MANKRNYILECSRLLYWIYFKPYTLKRWLQNIHPQLEPDNNPYLILKQFPHNKRLLRYTEQVFWLTTIVPQLTILLVGSIHTAVTFEFSESSESFNWLASELFYSGWILGNILTIYRYKFGDKKLLFIGIGNLFLIIALLTYGVFSGTELGVGLGAFYGMAFGVSPSIVLGMTYGVALCVSFGVGFGVFSGIALGVAFCVEFGVEFGVGFVVLFGIALGVTMDLVFAIAFGVTCIFGVLRVYFWFPELLWVGWLFLSTPQKKFAAKLPYLPPYFDQLIYLPLPFMSTILLEAYREQPNSARKTITYLINSSNQQRVAAKAIGNIALDTLRSCVTFRDIVTVHEELEWIPASFPGEIGTVLPFFLDISRSVQSADMATSVYRKVESLNNPIDSLIQRQNSFALVNNTKIATASGNIAQQWLSILNTARRNLEKESQYVREIPPVYIAGASLDPKIGENRFKGRQDIFREIENIALSSPPPTLLLYGNRRTGKTSTLKYLPQKVGGDLIPLRVDVQGIADVITLPGLAKSLAQQIIDSARIARNLSLPSPDRVEIETEPFLTLRNWFTTIERIAPNKRFLLCLDEFERLEEVIATTNSRAPLNFLRYVIQDRAAWTLLFSGSHTLDEMENYWSDYLIGNRYVRLTYLEKSEAQELITHPIPNFPDIYLPEAIERIIYWTRCQPYLIQLICSELVDYLNRQHPDNALNIKATSQDVDNVIDKALISGSPYFNEFWDITLNHQQRNAIRNLINKVDSIEKDRKVWRKLIQKEVLEYDSEGEIRFQVPLMERSVIQKIEEEF